jgi:hypothetical protein
VSRLLCAEKSDRKLMENGDTSGLVPDLENQALEEMNDTACNVLVHSTFMWKAALATARMGATLAPLINPGIS